VAHLLIDTDTASDDAVALLMALRHPGTEVEAVTVVAGNVPLDQAVQSALYTREIAESEVPVYAGRPAPREGLLRTAQFVHGKDGMGDIGLDLSGRSADEGDAVEVLIDRIRAWPGELILVTLGPLTNVAEAFERAPDLAGKLARLVMMVESQMPWATCRRSRNSTSGLTRRRPGSCSLRHDRPYPVDHANLQPRLRPQADHDILGHRSVQPADHRGDRVQMAGRDRLPCEQPVHRQPRDAGHPDLRRDRRQVGVQRRGREVRRVAGQ
jgi:hypothetical protein